MLPVVWCVIAVAFFIVEMATASFFFLWISAGAAVTAVSSLFVHEPWVQCTIFAVSSVILVAVSRPWAHKLTGGTRRPANVDALVGQTGAVTKVNQEFPWQGYIKVGGEMWKAESENKEPLAKDGQVTVLEARSNVLIVKVVH